MPVKWQMPYDALANKKGDVYTGSVMSDRVVRLDPKTGETVVYLMPGSTNIRRVNFDDEHNALWVGSNHGNSDRQNGAAGLTLLVSCYPEGGC